MLGTAEAPALWLVMVGLAVTGCLSIWFIAQANTLVQLIADPSMRGRVMGLWTMALPGTEPATSPSRGNISQTFGARDGFSLSGVALLLTAVTGWRALTDRPAFAGERADREADAEAVPAETTATAALAETAVLAEPPFADTA